MEPQLVLATTEEIEAFIQAFEDRTLPKVRWHHHAHLVVGLWYLSHNSSEDALSIIRQRIRAYNEVVGPPNTDTSGYHETLTRFFLRGIRAHIAAYPAKPLHESLSTLLQSPIASKEWPLTAYSRERLFSVSARRGWLESDLDPK